MNKVPLTKEGEKKLREELNRLRLERPKIIKDIAEAREHGDLKENAEYHAAREQQGIVEAKIKYIESKLSNSEIIDSTNENNKGKVIFGSKVELLNIDENSKIIYTIVGEDESDSSQNKISYNSPIGQGLVGKEIGDSVLISVPKGEINFKIIRIL